MGPPPAGWRNFSKGRSAASRRRHHPNLFDLEKLHDVIKIIGAN